MTESMISYKTVFESTQNLPMVMALGHGENADLIAGVTDNGVEVDLSGYTARAIYQPKSKWGTSDWYECPCEKIENTVVVHWGNTYDNGDNAVILWLHFLKDGKVAYPALYKIRLFETPGFTPNPITPIPETIDFSQYTLVNAPWALQSDFNSLSDDMVVIDTSIDNIFESINNISDEMDYVHNGLDALSSDFTVLSNSTLKTSQLTTSITSSSTDMDVPTGKAVYDAIQEGGGSSGDFVPLSGNSTITGNLSTTHDITHAGTSTRTVTYKHIDAFNDDNNYYSTGPEVIYDASHMNDIMNPSVREVDCRISGILDSTGQPEVEECKLVFGGVYSNIVNRNIINKATNADIGQINFRNYPPRFNSASIHGDYCIGSNYLADTTETISIPENKNYIYDISPATEYTDVARNADSMICGLDIEDGQTTISIIPGILIYQINLNSGTISVDWSACTAINPNYVWKAEIWIYKQYSGVTYTVNWPSSFVWVNGSAPDMADISGGKTMYIAMRRLIDSPEKVLANAYYIE